MEYRKSLGVRMLYSRPIDTEKWHPYLKGFFPYGVSCPLYQRETVLRFLEMLSEAELEIINQAAVDSVQESGMEQLYIIFLLKGEKDNTYQDSYGLAAEVKEATISFSEKTAILRIVVDYPKF